MLTLISIKPTLLFLQIATEKLHETYFNLRAAESKCLNSSSVDASPEPYAADAFLAALRDVNSTFEGTVT